MENMQKNMQNMQNLWTMPKICKICTPHLADEHAGVYDSEAVAAREGGAWACTLSVAQLFDRTNCDSRALEPLSDSSEGPRGQPPRIGRSDPINAIMIRSRMHWSCVHWQLHLNSSKTSVSGLSPGPLSHLLHPLSGHVIISRAPAELPEPGQPKSLAKHQLSSLSQGLLSWCFAQ